jgi:GT2 family glycosyltransferase
VITYQKKELSRGKFFVKQCLPSLSKDRQLFILVNDDGLDEISEFCLTASPFVRVLGGDGNLGVAGGRNFLINAAIEAGFNFFISCDNDLILEKDYFFKLEEGYQRLRLKDTKIGLVQSVLFDGRKMRAQLGIDKMDDWQTFGDGALLNTQFLGGIWQNLLSECSYDEATSCIYQAGISMPWLAHFKGSIPKSGNPLPWDVKSFKERFLTDKITLRSDPVLLASMMDAGTPVPVFTVAGGITAMHKDVFESLGGYNEKFNPFGYEDSEFGFRSTVKGKNNYLLTNVWAIHDPFLAPSNRELSSHASIARLRAIEFASLAPTDPMRGFAIANSMLFCWREHNAQFKKAIANSEISHKDMLKESTRFVASYVLNFMYGLFGVCETAPATSHLFDRLMPAGFDGDVRQDVELDLGRGCRFRATNLEIVHHVANNGRRIASLAAKNCRLEEVAAEGAVLTSRYFDAYLVLSETGTHAFELRCNFQSNEETFSARLSLDVINSMRSSLRSPPDVQVLEVKHQIYDLGAFSVEEIYPVQSFFASKRWLPELNDMVNGLKEEGGAFHYIAAAAAAYLGRRNLDEQIKLSHRSVPVQKPAHTLPTTKKKILIFTDSRGQHKPAGRDYLIFGEKLAKDSRFSVELVLCPMKWTTTLDFLEHYPSETLSQYDHVILYTGIVDWSPRRVTSAVSDLYDNPHLNNIGNLALNTRDYSQKIVNNKKRTFDQVFGVRAMTSHFAQPLGTVFEGEQTANMYGLEMASSSLLPRLSAIPNLIFISANRFVEGWNGDYKRQRPANIGLTHAYSDLFSEGLPTARVVDLRKWSAEEVKIYTCDNLHLSERGSNYIYDRIMEVLGVEPAGIQDASDAWQISKPAGMANGFNGMRTPERITANKKAPLLAAANRTGFLATLVIGVRLAHGDSVRNTNLKTLLRWIDHFYGDLFDVLLVEQDSESRLRLKDLDARPYVRHQFIYNPQEYNRGWGYNVAISRFCTDTQVVALMDTDVLTGSNFVREVIDCHSKYDAISPYQNIYYTDAEEAVLLQRCFQLEPLVDPKKIKNPVTVSGGILIIKRSVFMSVNGFEQYLGYGCEDRALDVTLFNQLAPARIRISGQAYVHLYHAADQGARVQFNEIYHHLVTNYGCKYEPTLGPYDFIHEKCHHTNTSDTLRLTKRRASSFGDMNLYRHEGDLSINGIVNKKAIMQPVREVIFPSDFNTLSVYPEKELYAKVPEPDTDELAALYNAFKGKRCFIIGNGPSLNKHDLTLLKDEYTFGVNSFYYKTRETGFKPYFYVVEDSSVMKENIEEIRKFDTHYKFFPTNYKSLHPKQPNTVFFRMNRGFYEKSSPNYVVPRFSTDASKVLYCGQSVTYINLQLAYFMGFTEVYLIGMDFSYVIPESHKRTGDVLLSDTDDQNHFHKDYFGKGKTWKDPKLDRVALNYKQAKLVFEATGRKIFNATNGGSLEIFERVDYETLLTGSNTNERDASTMSGRFEQANRLFQGKDYGKALTIYVELARLKSDFFTYKRSAMDSYLRAVEHQCICNADDVAYVRGLIVGF